MFFNILRWCIFAIVLIIQSGAFLEGEWLTGISGALYCFFLTMSPETIKERFKVKYLYVFMVLLFIFLFSSYIDMSDSK